MFVVERGLPTELGTGEGRVEARTTGGARGSRQNGGRGQLVQGGTVRGRCCFEGERRVEGERERRRRRRRDG